MLGSIGPMEIVIILAVCVLIFGPRQLPKVGRSIGEAIKEFRNVGREIARGHDEDEADADKTKA